MTEENNDTEIKEEAILEEGKKKESKMKKAFSRKSASSKLKDKNAELEEELSEMKDKYLRLFAEFDNFKKRSVKEKLDLMKTAAQDTISSILPVLDDFDRAKLSAESDDNDEQLSEGVLMVYNKIYAVMTAKGLEKMVPTGEEFDPEQHEAISEIPAGEEMKGKIVDTVQSGYSLKEKIIRHAKVVVGK